MGSAVPEPWERPLRSERRRRDVSLRPICFRETYSVACILTRNISPCSKVSLTSFPRITTCCVDFALVLDDSTRRPVFEAAALDEVLEWPPPHPKIHPNQYKHRVGNCPPFSCAR